MARSNDAFRHVNPETNRLWTRPELWRDNTRLKSELETVKATADMHLRNYQLCVKEGVVTPKQYVNDLKRRSQIVFTELKSLGKDLMWLGDRVRHLVLQFSQRVVEASHRI